MRSTAPAVLIVLLLLGCKRERDPAQAPAPTPSPVPVAAPDAAVATGPTWYRAVLRGEDGTEVVFFLGVPAPGASAGVVFKIGAHEARRDATFDGKELKVPMDVHLSSIEGTVAADGTLRGTFSASWRAFGTATLELAAAKIDAPAPSALATVSAEGTLLDLGESRTVWRLAMSESGVGKLVIDQVAPGDFTGVLRFDTGNTVYVAGNGRGDTAVLSGFDGTSGYRLELALGADRKRAQGKWISGHRFDWRETFTATRGADFPFAAKARPRRPGVKIGLPPDYPALAALEPGPLLVELAGSWCTTCRYAAPFLVELHREYAPRGLRMVTLLYEFTDDPEADAKQAEAFKKTYGVTWPVVPIRGDLDEFTEIVPSGLADLHPSGFPVTLFLAADRSLVALHAGFPAPDAAERPQVEAELRGHAEALVGGARLK
jgi:thiol-disulfide isomerase/thioredoxin